MRRGTASALVLVVAALPAGCGGGGSHAPTASTPTTAGAAVVSGASPAVVSTPDIPACGQYPGPSDVQFGGLVPATTTPPAPADPALAARALRPGDVPCTRETRAAALDPYKVEQFSPCGFPFADTSTAAGEYRIALEPAIGYVGDQGRWPLVPYVDEVVARFTPARADGVFADFRSQVDACPYGTGTNMRVFQDVPQLVRVGLTTWDLSPVEVPVELDDVYAVEFFRPGTDRYLLVALRRGPYVAFLRTSYRAGDQRGATPFLVAAAARLAGA